jgi:hypothetical protein
VPKSGGRRRKKKGGRRKNGRGKKNKMEPTHGRPVTIDHRLALAVRSLVGDCWSPTSGRPVAAGRLCTGPTAACLLSIFLILFIYFKFGVMRYLLAFGKNGCTIHPFFQASPYTWKCQIFQSS